MYKKNYTQLNKTLDNFTTTLQNFTKHNKTLQTIAQLYKQDTKLYKLYHTSQYFTILSNPILYNNFAKLGNTIQNCTNYAQLYKTLQQSITLFS